MPNTQKTISVLIYILMPRYSLALSLELVTFIMHSNEIDQISDLKKRIEICFSILLILGIYYLCFWKIVSLRVLLFAHTYPNHWPLPMRKYLFKIWMVIGFDHSFASSAREHFHSKYIYINFCSLSHSHNVLKCDAFVKIYAVWSKKIKREITTIPTTTVHHI